MIENWILKFASWSPKGPMSYQVSSTGSTQPASTPGTYITPSFDLDSLIQWCGKWPRYIAARGRLLLYTFPKRASCWPLWLQTWTKEKWTRKATEKIHISVPRVFALRSSKSMGSANIMTIALGLNCIKITKFIGWFFSGTRASVAILLS